MHPRVLVKMRVNKTGADSLHMNPCSNQLCVQPLCEIQNVQLCGGVEDIVRHHGKSAVGGNIDDNTVMALQHTFQDAVCQLCDTQNLQVQHFFDILLGCIGKERF